MSVPQPVADSQIEVLTVTFTTPYGILHGFQREGAFSYGNKIHFASLRLKTERSHAALGVGWGIQRGDLGALEVTTAVLGVTTP